MKIAARRVHTGSFEGEQMQRTAQQTAALANDTDDRVATLETNAYRQVSLLKDYTTTEATAQTTPLSVTVAKGDIWHVEFWGLAGCSTVNGMKYALKAPVGSTVSGTLHSSLGSATTLAYSTVSAPNTLSSAVHTVAGGLRGDWMTARVRVAADGVIAIQVASNTAGDTTTLGALATMRLTRTALVT